MFVQASGGGGNNIGVEDIVVRSFNSASITVAANATATVYFSGISLSGYTPLLAFYGGNNNSSVVVGGTAATTVSSSGTASLSARNTSGGAVTAVFTCWVIFVKKTT